MLKNTQSVSISSPTPVTNSNANAENREEPIVVVKSVAQVSDVTPSDANFETLRSLIDRYGIAIVYADTTFKGSKELTRYELAVTLNSTTNQTIAIVDTMLAPYATQAQMQTAEKSLNDLMSQMVALRDRVDRVEAEQFMRQSSQMYLETTHTTAPDSWIAFNSLPPSLSSPQTVASTTSNNIAQTTTTSQIPDVKPYVWAFQALQSLVERYGLGDVLLYPDGTFKGEQPLTRDRFALILNRGLIQVVELFSSSTGDKVQNAELEAFIDETEDIAKALEFLRARVNRLEANQASS